MEIKGEFADGSCYFVYCCLHEAHTEFWKSNCNLANFVSGMGKEHMALISALLKLGVGIRLMALTKNGIEEV